MPEVKRNLIQVRLTDAQLSEFDDVKKLLHVSTSADALRKLINDKKLTSGVTKEALNSAVDQYNDLSAKLDSLLWNSSNITNNVNQASHVLNVAAQNDPEDVETWNWVMQQLQSIRQATDSLSQLVDDVKDWLHKSRVAHGNSNV